MQNLMRKMTKNQKFNIQWKNVGDFGLKFWDLRTVQKSAVCRSRRELSNAYLLAKIGVDTAENEPCKVCPLSLYRSPRFSFEYHSLGLRPHGRGGWIFPHPIENCRHLHARAVSRNDQVTDNLRWHYPLVHHPKCYFETLAAEIRRFSTKCIWFCSKIPQLSVIRGFLWNSEKNQQHFWRNCKNWANALSIFFDKY